MPQFELFCLNIYFSFFYKILLLKKKYVNGYDFKLTIKILYPSIIGYKKKIIKYYTFYISFKNDTNKLKDFNLLKK